MLCFGSIEMDCAISESCYKGKTLQRNDRKTTMEWSFHIIPLENSMVIKKLGSHNMTVLYLNLCYNEARYKGTALCIS